MKPKTAKRAKIDRQAKPYRDMLKAAGVCEWCHRHREIDVHEISQGHRLQSLQEPSCVLAICRDCHELLHRMPDKRTCGLAILYLSRTSDYDLGRYHEVTHRVWPDQSEVDEWVARLTAGTPYLKGRAV